jgi:hypothetical protein
VECDSKIILIIILLYQKSRLFTDVIFGGPQGDRTPHLFHAMEALYQMS